MRSSASQTKSAGLRGPSNAGLAPNALERHPHDALEPVDDLGVIGNAEIATDRFLLVRRKARV